MSILKSFDLSGKTALVTGCKRGIGMAIAEALAEAGADIIGVSLNLATENSNVQERINSLGRNFYPYVCDFSDRTALYGFLAEVKKKHPVIDILVNNAGYIHRSPAAEHTDSSWDRVIAINQDAAFILTREFGKEMLSRGTGKILFIASLLSFQGGINVPSYAASKGAIAAMTKAFANEWAAAGINVNAIAPGYIATDNTQALRDNPERANAILSRIPAARWGEPQDIKGAALFLASSAADYIHGSILTVDGGWMAR